MKILVDADACPVKEIIERIAQEHRLPVLMFIDTSHILYSDYSEIVLVSKAPDAVDFALMNRTERGDIVISQDYGVAAMALGRGAYAIHPSGKLYNDSNIDIMLMERDIAKQYRRAGTRQVGNSKTGGRARLTGHAKKRTAADDDRFAKALSDLCDRLCDNGSDT
jgi:uncharacterized protein YaiI (UPF0178 family)